jgi:hypothetical protein
MNIEDYNLILLDKLSEFKDIDNNFFFNGYNGIDFLISKTKDDECSYIVYSNFENIKFNEKRFENLTKAYSYMLNCCLTLIFSSTDSSHSACSKFTKIYNFVSSHFPNVKLIDNVIIIPFLFLDNKYKINGKYLTHIIISKLTKNVKVSLGFFDNDIEKYSVDLYPFSSVIEDIINLFVSSFHQDEC